MIINFTNYYGQTQYLGLVSILKYYGTIPFAEIREEYILDGRTTDFTIISRAKDFTASGRTKDFTVIGQ